MRRRNLLLKRTVERAEKKAISHPLDLLLRRWSI
jgi:hypothetical protein